LNKKLEVKSQKVLANYKIKFGAWNYKNKISAMSAFLV